MNRARAGLLAGICLSAVAAFPESLPPGFDPIFDLLTEHCGECHVRGQADGPWSLDLPATNERYAPCLSVPTAEQLRCTTFHQLVDAPAPGIPAWIRPDEGAESEPYVQACDPAVSFHIGHSLPAPLDAADCARFLDWITAGAPR